MKSLGQGSSGGGGALGSLDSEKRAYLVLTAVLCGLLMLGSLAACALGGTGAGSETGFLFVAGAIQLLLTWFILYIASSCFKWSCVVLMGLQVLSSLIGIFTIPMAIMQGGVPGGVWVFIIIGYLLGLAYNAWFVSILYRDLTGYEY